MSRTQAPVCIFLRTPLNRSSNSVELRLPGGQILWATLDKFRHELFGHPREGTRFDLLKEAGVVHRRPHSQLPGREYGRVAYVLDVSKLMDLPDDTIVTHDARTKLQRRITAITNPVTPATRLPRPGREHPPGRRVSPQELHSGRIGNSPAALAFTKS